MATLRDVTVLITTFLRPGYLRACLAGLKETLPECKCLVVDDGDLTILLDSVTAHEVFVLPFDSGLPAKRNLGVRRCETEYLLLGCDDFNFRPLEVRQGIEKLVHVLDDMPHIAVAGGRVDNRHYEGFLEHVPGQYIREHGLPIPRSTDPPQLCDLTVNYFLARTSMIRDVPWDERMKIGGEHADWFLDLKEKQRPVVFVPGVNIDTLYLGNAPEIQDPRYKRFRDRATPLGHQIMKQKRDIKDYYAFDGSWS